VVTPCYNEEENIEELFQRVRVVFDQLADRYSYEHIFIDNASTDKTVTILRRISKDDRRCKVINNSRNFGHIRSPYHGLVQADGDAVVMIVADLQDPPEMISDFIAKWEEGNKIVIAVKTTSKENSLMFRIRKLYYVTLAKLSDVHIHQNFTGFGLYDRQIVEALRDIKDTYPFLRGIIAELGFKTAKIPFIQPRRERGITKNNFYTLYDIGILGIIANSKIPLRITLLFGFLLSLVSFLIGSFYLIAKLIYWDSMSVGIAPLLIGHFFFLGMILIFLGVIGEYVGAIYTQVMERPRVYEEERINFDE